MAKVLEICADSLASARAAIAGGADRIELCSALTMGGLTPWEMLLRQIREESRIPVRCLMRPRAGDFLYTREEIALMGAQMEQLGKAGADGFVIGCLNPEGELDREAMKFLAGCAGGKNLTLHRCIDVSRDPEKTYLDAMELGIDTVLTSGCASNCLGGLPIIERLLNLRDLHQGPEVLVGAGVKAAVIRRIRAALPQARAFHMSGKTEIPSGMLFRRDGVPMGAPGLDEWHIQVTGLELVRQSRIAMDE